MISRRAFLASSLAATSATFTGKHAWQRFVPSRRIPGECPNQNHALSSISPDRLLRFDHPIDLPTLASQLTNYYFEPKSQLAWNARILSGQMICIIFQDAFLCRRDWWLVVCRSEDPIRLIAVDFRSSGAASGTGILMARVAFRLRRYRNEVSHLLADHWKLLQFVNEHILGGTGDSPN